MRKRKRTINVDPCKTCGNIGTPFGPCERVGCPYQGPHLGDPKLSEMRQVELHYIDRAPDKYLVHQCEVRKFVEASKRLHFKPGKNPHNGAKCPKIFQITVSRLRPTGPFWWTTPDLQNNHDPNGARVFNGDYGPRETAFIDQATVDQWRAEEERAEYEFEMGEDEESPDQVSKEP